MRKLNASVAAVIAAALLTIPTQAAEPVRARTTAYTEGVAGTGHTTASGQEVREGIIATKAIHLGGAAYIWLDTVDENGKHQPGEFIGLFDCEDTGGPGVQNGVIDVYRDNLERCDEWMEQTGGWIWVQIINAEG